MIFRSLFLIAFLFLSCTSQPEKKIANHAFPLPMDYANDPASFEHIGNIVADKGIVILGESGHGDGKTHELKYRLTKYLIEKKGFNTFAGEGTGFLDMYILNENPPEVPLPPNFLRNIWTQSWGKSIPMEDLPHTLDKNQVKYIGLESYSHLLSQSPEMGVAYLKNNLKVSDQIKLKEILNEIKKTFHRTFDTTATVSENEIVQYIENLETVKASLEQQNHTEEEEEEGIPEALIMVIENIICEAEQLKHQVIGTYAAENIAINIRDKQMAKNLIWHKERNRNAKIIVWTANFHGAKKIREIRYKEDEPDLYNDFVLLGEHLHNAYGNDVYSIAFTAANGETSNAYWEKEKTKKIDAANGTLEKELYDNGMEYGFLDFSALRKSDPELKNQSFNTQILAHDNKPGKWLQVFDGMFFLKTQRPFPNQ